jgi:hypothetical protein
VSARGCSQAVEEIGDGRAEAIVVGERSWIGLVLEGAMAEELKFFEQMRRRACIVRNDAVFGCQSSVVAW